MDNRRTAVDETRILIVDDVEDAAQTLAELLTLSGYVTRTACNGADALAVIREFAPHCVLLDVSMPEMDGSELVKHLRAQHGDEIVLIAVTGADQSDARVADTFERVDHYLTKPVDMSALMKILPPLHAEALPRT
jgi:CheY-like chemotaxis protein